jgi:glutamate N-acetyltransferase (EC 2.3.1.35)
MAVNLLPPDCLLPVPGVRLGVAAAGIRKAGRDDLLLIELAAGSRVAGVFTRNAFAAAPVLLCRELLASGRPVRGLLVNAGNANAATGAAGLQDARDSVRVAAQVLAADDDGVVLPFSTGVIGQRLPMDRLLAAVPVAQAALAADGWLAAARAIMTTDTVAKGASRSVEVDGQRYTVTGIAKGVGMICPNMATMLAFIATDAPLTAAATEAALRAAVARSFNCVTVDGDTSTNDACVLAATGGGPTIGTDSAGYATVAAAIESLCVELAQAIARDGEGATRFITIEVAGARDEEEARQVAYSIAHSPLVKTAMFAGDANWGRIIMAIGKAGVEDLDPATVGVRLDAVPLIAAGEPHPDYREERGAAVVAQPEFTIGVELGRGAAGARLWTCDFSYDYVRINAEYRS